MNQEKKLAVDEVAIPPLTVIYEDPHLLVINKPAGVVVNRAQSVKVPTLQDQIEEYLRSDPVWQSDRRADAVFAERSGMVHRLDKDTSGVQVWAKRAAAMHNLLQQFETREVQKTYLALVHGRLKEPVGLIDVAIERNPKNREKFTVTAQGRASQTTYAVQKYWPGFDQAALRLLLANRGVRIPNLGGQLKLYEGGFSLVALKPKTGRTHQIRVHMDFLHHPLVGDARYTGRKKARLDELWCPRQWLHAWKLQFRHPDTGKNNEYIVPIPADLESALRWLVIL